MTYAASPITRGIYTPPKELKIAGIETIVVDPHNEVLFYWKSCFNGEPFLVLHIDSHSDMVAWDVKPIDIAMKGNIDWRAYSQLHVGISSFISTAAYYGLINTLLFYNPRFPEYMAIYGLNAPLKNLTKLSTNTINWVNGEPQTRAIIRFSNKYRDVKLSNTRIIVDIDLDGIVLEGHPNPNPEVSINSAMQWLAQFPKPNLITIARSQTPQTFAPPELVNEMEEKVVKALNSLYSSIPASQPL
ncbi:UPF0489 family protein [Candidatus Woesearchaeota archaeon]|nr:UPF0489 family protein [Candidatus Woesearchaeota archaeon]